MSENMSFAEKVHQVLDEQVNPAIQGHGGFVRVNRIEDVNVFLEMGGGCQGCAASSSTLKFGIENLLREEIPEIGDIIDVTDHSSGQNPYFIPYTSFDEEEVENEDSSSSLGERVPSKESN